jgi:DNA-binding CsgD family transcriptional regulator
VRHGDPGEPYMQAAFQTMTRIIRSVGDDDFAATAAHALCELTSFELVAIVVHYRGAPPSLIFANFASSGSGLGLQNYLSKTHRLNPVLQGFREAGAIRASDYKATPTPDRKIQPYFHKILDEELGFLTVGWPAGMEEIGLYFEALSGIVEFCMYRERARTPASAKSLHTLNSLCEPIAAAFSRHGVLANIGAPLDELSSREKQVADLMLRGCTSEAIALRLQISCHTVKEYRKQIFRKLHISSLAELFALSRRLTPQPPRWGGVAKPQ